jgi:uracil-DNA glycosylase family 4
MDLMIVGKNPSKTRPAGQEEVAFSGRTSHILWDELAKYGITRADCFVTNVITDHIDWKDITPEITEKNRIRLEAEIKEQRPLVILAVGVEAQHYFGLRPYSGFPIHYVQDKKRGCWIVACVHPGYVARFPGCESQTIEPEIYLCSEMLKDLRKVLKEFGQE